MAVVDSISFRINRGIGDRVAQLGRASLVPMERVALRGQALSVEGEWDPQGVFVAREIERLPWSRRPKLRGAIEGYDDTCGELTLFGRRIRITPETEVQGAEGSEVSPPEDLRPGRRAEISCRLDEGGNWIARKISLRNLKASSKIKGEITEVLPDDGPVEELVVHGLRIVVPPDLALTVSKGLLHRMETATRMTLAVDECLAAAQELLKEGYRAREMVDGVAVNPAPALADIEDRLRDSGEGFTRNLADSRAQAEAVLRDAVDGDTDSLATAARDQIALWLEPLSGKGARFDSGIAELLTLAGRDPEAAQRFLQGDFDPFLQEHVLPLVRAYHLDTEEQLADELQAISQRADSAARLTLITNFVGLVLALGLGLVVSRSISKPIRALQSAARNVGSGNLETRVEVRSHDEVGELAATFNRMTERLAASTVSVSNLNNVIDSMAGALFLLDHRGEIMGVNPAATSLLGYDEGELVGQPFAEICSPSEGSTTAGTDAVADVGVGIVEKVLRKKTGEAVPVSFSGAVMRKEDGSSRGFVCLAQDLSERLRMEQRLLQSLREKELLLREVHHRVKNNLQVISSLLDLQSRAVSDPVSLAKFRQCQDCILSMVFIHEQLHRARDLDTVDLRLYLEQIVANLSQAYLVLPDRIGVRMQVADLDIDIDRALACGLVVNELVTNALKHAFPGDEPGEIAVFGRRGDDGQYVLEVSDSGRGFDNALGRDSTDSLGLSLVDTLVLQLQGRIDFDGRDGAAYRIQFPARYPVEMD